MAVKNLTEMLGFKASAYKHWDPHLVVGLSAFCLGIPSCAFLSVLICIVQAVTPPYGFETWIHLVFYAILCLFYSFAVILCALADFVFIRRNHRSYYGKVDIFWASLTFFASNVNFALRAGIVEPALCSALAVAAFLYSGSSKSFDQWVFRHSLWHLIAGCIGSYGAFRLAPEGPQTAARIWPMFGIVLGAYLVAIAASLGLCAIFLPKALRTSVWEFGAKYACWTAVAT
mmetsp:Transcript_81299/g.206490  ORF Transcript_81299/g.206490 Transcript_81299/m.206490 type:complete len:230 (+) Transcript_81299:138-827(+)|eukprot:CAMPEP_0183448134 /NCGR_PEP_ID=MMETSP0370-20130417/105310_1 /TAXON_ID=268820 /ORGANISM="Peridinium aciculiferum, Strain PAER-2" /LENGTH=229 /DNA_ID=CAMNT_0025639059 /DNA_START=60 /DNA_END=749 /DNA_ORIENTATION=-